MPKLTESQQALRRAHILDAAEVCFARSGFHQTTMQDIRREARVSAGGLYVYFASKEALIDGIVERDREEIAAELRQVGKAPDLMSGLAGLLRACVLERPAHKAALYIEMLSEANRNPHVAAAVQSCEVGLTVALTEMLREGQAAGRISSALDPAAGARMLLLVGDGLFVLIARRAREEVDAVTPHVLNMIAAYLTRPDADGREQALPGMERGLPVPPRIVERAECR